MPPRRSIGLAFSPVAHRAWHEKAGARLAAWPADAVANPVASNPVRRTVAGHQFAGGGLAGPCGPGPRMPPRIPSRWPRLPIMLCSSKTFFCSGVSWA